MSSNQASGGFSLFPNPNNTKPPSRKTTPRPRAATPQSISQGRGPSLEMTPPQNVRPTQEDLSAFVIDGTPAADSESSAMAPNDPFVSTQALASSSRPVLPTEAPPRTDTAMSGASTLVRSPSGRSRSSIAKRPIDEAYRTPPPPQQQLRSIFPQYDHTLPFDRQEYYPTQTSPTHIPRQVISRQSHVPQQAEARSPPVRSPVRSPQSITSGTSRWANRRQEPAVIPRVSTTEELRDYWKAANGWQATATEGRGYCMKLMPEKDTPIYGLTSQTQPFYHMRIDPTSASAKVTLMRHDPSKPCKEPDPHAPTKSTTGLRAALREAEGKVWQEAIVTTLEEPSRRLPPNDGLVALLYPTAASKIALERPHDAAAVAAAERECARLVWDDDSQNYFLAHPAVATPFCVTVERSPAYSRTEYTVEHIESPLPLAKLTRDGTGEGWLEADTLVAGRVEAYYVLDVAVAALLLVAHVDERNVLVEQFAPPPAAHLRTLSRSRSDEFLRSTSRLSSKILGQGLADGGSKKDKKKRRRISELELDLESQASSLGGKLSIKDKDQENLPGTARTAIKLLGFAFKCVIWALTLAFKAMMALVVGLTKCLTSEKL
ncbi:hypothetical protein F5Y15DRAFT_127045 [Xylariaceae sp. FL0016]|nr:hypothetical protein F5Y15DRAFT_127045 [Xylariaceae sp. FL0016]